MTSTKTIEAYKGEIIHAINEIEEYTKGLTMPEFIRDTKTYNATMMCLALIGENASKFPQHVREQNQGIPWGDIIGLRNRISHDYFGLDEEVIWKTIKESLPKFREEIKQLHD